MSANLDTILKLRLSEIIPIPEFYVFAAPIFMVLIGAIVALLLGVFRGDPDKPSLTSFGIAIVSLSCAALLPLALNFRGIGAFLGSGFLSDSMGVFGIFMIAVGTLYTLLVASATNTGRLLLRPEMIALLLFASGGMMVMVCAGEFLSFFVGLEITSVSLYVLVGYQRQDTKGLEAAIKYFLLGSTAAGVMLMGMALVYLQIGSLRWVDFSKLQLDSGNVLGSIGMALFLCGMAFKLALAPFHSWAPDVYQGAHSTLTGYMASLVKFSLMIVMIRILGAGVGSGSPVLVKMFWVLGAASIVVGSFYGLAHRSIKRMLAYSSVANAGYFCLGFAALAANPGNNVARQALLAHGVIYTLLTLGMFATISMVEEGNIEDVLREELGGLGKRSPGLAVAMTLFLFGLAGIPPLAGFFSKFMLINAAVSQGLVGLAIVLVVLSCVSLFYYLGLMVEIWFKPTSRNSVDIHRTSGSKLLGVLIGAAAVGSIAIGVFGPRWVTLIDWVVAVERTSAAQNPTVNPVVE